ncbi:DUF7509 family protein [Halobacterium yunchengense]|uniref:DUF7509 family protein n=1 Tax=Halobacterium yunchengense TaxID=3108497 RepID=UPI003009467A
MRERLLSALDDSDTLTHPASKRGFLVYLMGPYKSYPPYESPRPAAEVPTDRGTLDEVADRVRDGLDLDADDALALLVALRRDLRADTGVNAFLATDPGIPLSEVDAATQSIAFADAATATVFVAPAMGDNLGVGIEVGSVCEHLDDDTLLTDAVFLGERGVESSMVDAVAARWHVTVDEFDGYDDLYRAVRVHLRAVA